MAHLAVSPMRTPGFLSWAIRRLASSGKTLAGSVQRRFATEAKEWHNSIDTDLKQAQSLLHPEYIETRWHSPLMCNAADLITVASNESDKTGHFGGRHLQPCQEVQVDQGDVCQLGYPSPFFLN